MESLSSCPICGAVLQSTVEEWNTGAVIAADASGVLDYGKPSGVGDDSRVYCANDHTLDEMAEHLESLR